MPPGDSKNAELGRMKNKLIELEASLKEERKTVARLRDQGEKKLQQIMDVDADIAAEQERFRWAKEDWLFQIRSAENEAAMRIETLKEEQKKLLGDISEFSVLQYENEQLHLKLKHLSIEHKKISQQQFEEREKKKQRDFDLRMQMDEIFRKTLKNVDENYEQQAIAKMKFEASQANVENDEIYKEFDLREKQTEALIRQQQHSYDELMKLRIEKDVLGMSIKMQEKNVKKFRKQNIELEKEVKELMKKVERLRDEVQALSIIASKKSNLLNECTSVRNETEAVKVEVAKRKKITTNICQKLLLKSIKITEKATVNQNNQLSDTLDGLGGEDAPDFLPSLNSPAHIYPTADIQQHNIGFENTGGSESAFDHDSVWQSSNNNSRFQSKIKRAQVEDKYLSQSFSMSAL